MSIQYQTPVSVTPAATTADGPVKFTLDILVTGGNASAFDVEYTILDPRSAVHFRGGKSERLRVPVTATQMTIVNDTRLVCGPGDQDFQGADVMVAISSDGVFEATPIVCGVGITSYTCAEAAPQLTSGPKLSHALMSSALASMMGAAVVPPTARAAAPRTAPEGKRGAKKEKRAKDGTAAKGKRKGASGKGSKRGGRT